MKTAAVVCNILFFAFLCVVLVTDGPPTQTAYIVFSLLSLLIPIFSAVVIVRSKASDGWLSLQVRRKNVRGTSKDWRPGFQAHDHEDPDGRLQYRLARIHRLGLRGPIPASRGRGSSCFHGTDCVDSDSQPGSDAAWRRARCSGGPSCDKEFFHDALKPAYSTPPAVAR